MKRLVDILVSASALLVLSPVIALVAVAVRADVGRPILFRQERPGHSETPFILLKFRTMRGEVPTALGRLLRSWSLDELPQLLNVLRGDMSLVGPRPLLMKYLPFYTERERMRHRVRPGITGWAQIHGRNSLSWDDRLEMDAWYVEHRSFWLDLKILARTFGAVLGRSGVEPNPAAFQLADLDVERGTGV